MQLTTLWVHAWVKLKHVSWVCLANSFLPLPRGPRPICSAGNDTTHPTKFCDVYNTPHNVSERQVNSLLQPADNSSAHPSCQTAAVRWTGHASCMFNL